MRFLARLKWNVKQIDLDPPFQADLGLEADESESNNSVSNMYPLSGYLPQK